MSKINCGRVEGGWEGSLEVNVQTELAEAQFDNFSSLMNYRQCCNGITSFRVNNDIIKNIFRQLVTYSSGGGTGFIQMLQFWVERISRGSPLSEYSIFRKRL
jgi:hypothetical protein